MPMRLALITKLALMNDDGVVITLIDRVDDYNLDELAQRVISEVASEIRNKSGEAVASKAKR